MADADDAAKKLLGGNAKWLLAVLVAFISSGGGAYWLSAPGETAKAAQGRVEKLEAKLDAAHEDRHSVVESDVKAIRVEQAKQGRLLSKIAAKMRITEP